MSLKQSVSLQLGQSLTMTPALQQAIRMLQLSTVDLHAEIQDALESNLMLEPDDNAEAAVTDAGEGGEQQRSGDNIPENLPVDADWDDVYGNSAPPPRDPGSDAQALWDDREANLHTPPDLHAHLIWQAELQGFEGVHAELAAHIIDAIDSHGYVTEWPAVQARLCNEFDVASHEPEAILATIQKFDPGGVGARDLAECLRLQLDQMHPHTPGRGGALVLATAEGLQALAADDRSRMERMVPDPAELEAASALIPTLQPHPGEDFGEQQPQYIAPEVHVMRAEGRWQVSLNTDIAPRLRINPDYQALASRAESSADQSTLKTHLQEARFFLKSLRSRNETLLRVAQRIVEAQQGFLEYGEEGMQPLILRDVADELEMHESTVSRATANKYMQTPRGLFELKYFFSSHVATTDGGACSAIAIQAMIRRLVAGEPAAKPLSDSRLADRLLEDRGIRVARRTIAKYREALAIPPSSQRRRSNA